MLVDGSERGRAATFVRAIVPADDGARVFFATGGGGLPIRVFSCSLIDGAVALVAESAGAVNVAIATSRARAFFAGDGAEVLWRDLDTVSEGSVSVPRGAQLVAVSPDGAAFCTVRYERSDASRTSVHRVSDGRIIATIATRGAPTFDDDGRAILRTAEGAFVAVSPGDESVRELVPTLRMTGALDALHAERGGTRLLVVGFARYATLLDLETGAVLRSLPLGRESRVDGFARGKALLRERGETFSLVDVETGVRTELPPLGMPAALTRDGETVVAFREPLLVAFDVAKGALRGWHDGHERPVIDLAWSSDGALLASLSIEGVVRVWDVRSRCLLWVFEGARGNAAAIVFAPDGRLLYAIGQRALLAWDLSTGDEAQRHSRAGHRVSAVAISPDGRYLATLGAGMPPRVYDLSDGARRVAVLDAPKGASSIAFTREGNVRLFGSASSAATWVSWCDPFGKALSSREHEGLRGFVGFDDDASSLLVLRERRVVRFDLRDGSESDLSAGAYESALCANARFAVVASVVRGKNAVIERVRVVPVSVATGREVGAIEVVQFKVRASLSPGGGHLALSYGDGRVEVFALDDTVTE